MRSDASLEPSASRGSAPAIATLFENDMKERPILFSADMVRAILTGTKTQTRRVIKPQPDDDGIVEVGQIGNTRGIAYIRGSRGGQCERVACPYGVIGDHLWVKETWRSTATNLEEARAITDDIMNGSAIDYKADYVEGMMREGPMSREEAEECMNAERWRSSRFMPRWASRITLVITDVCVERLQEISEDDARAEGARCADRATGREVIFPDQSQHIGSYKLHFRELWDSLNAKRGFGWNANPHVWVISFRRIK